MKLGVRMNLIKSINHRRIDFIYKILDEVPIERSEYFYARIYEIRNLTVRGSIIISLKPDFVSRQKKFWRYGCVSDSGFLEASKVKPKYLGFSDFQNSLGEQRLIDKNDTESARLNKKFLSPEQYQLICKLDWPELLCFEFCLFSGFSVHRSDVENISVPNSFTHLRRLLKREGIAVKSYNPRFGIEGAIYDW